MAGGADAQSLTPRARREPLPDALRALALIGVLMVNAMGYQDVPFGRLLGEPQPPESALAVGLVALVAAFIQGKAYPVLAFLFGVGMAYAMRGRGRAVAVQGARRRARRLLTLGVLHGTLLYFGDILTLYALCAFWVAWQMHGPWRVLLGRLRAALAWAILAVAASTALAFVSFGPARAATTIGTTAGIADFLGLNAGTYAVAQVFGLLLTLPLVRLSMLAGVAAGRLRLLTHPRWRALAGQIVRHTVAPALAANVAYASAYVGVPPSRPALSLALESASALWATPLALVYVALAVQAWHRRTRRWTALLAPLGQHTLSLYIGASLLMALCFSGAGLGFRPTTVQWVLGALALWALAAVASTVSRGRWPLEAWMARR
jgi:uncharacterized protein